MKAKKPRGAGFHALYTPQSLASTLVALGDKPISPRRVSELARAAGVKGLTLVDLAIKAGYLLQGTVSRDLFYTDADLRTIRAARGPGRDRQSGVVDT
jgi:hypothetical protein